MENRKCHKKSAENRKKKFVRKLETAMFESQKIGKIGEKIMEDGKSLFKAADRRKQLGSFLINFLAFIAA